MKRHIFKNKGFSLIELLIVLGIVMAMAVGGFFVFQKVNIEHKAKLEAEDLVQIAKVQEEFSNGYASQTYYPSEDEEQFFQDHNNVLAQFIINEVVPKSATHDKGDPSNWGLPQITYTNHFGGKTTLNAGSIFYQNIPVEACSKILGAWNSLYETPPGTYRYKTCASSEFFGYLPPEATFDNVTISFDFTNKDVQIIPMVNGEEGGGGGGVGA